MHYLTMFIEVATFLTDEVDDEVDNDLDHVQVLLEAENCGTVI